MPADLTLKQDQFAVRVGTEGLSIGEAYKLTYDCSQLKPEQISRRSRELARSPGVAARIGALRGAAAAEAARKAAYSLADAIAEADNLLKRALAKDNLTAANTAAALKAKLAGHLVEKKEIKMGALEQADVEELEAMREELRRRLAERRGIDAPPDDSNRPVLRPS